MVDKMNIRPKTMDAKDLIERLKMDVICPICLGYFFDPVIVKCGHTFCKECLLSLWEEPDTTTTCPNCKEVIEFEDFICNRRIQGTTINGMLVIPYLLLSIRDLSTCDKHGKEEILFCEEDQRPLCGSCSLATEHKDHKVITLDRAAHKFMNKLQETWNILKCKMNEFKTRLRSEQIREEWWVLEAQTMRYWILVEYEKMYQFLWEEVKQQFQKLDKEARDNLIVKENKDSKSKEILKQPMNSEKQPVEMLKLEGKATKESVKSEFDKKHRFLTETKQLHLRSLDEEVKDYLEKFQESKAEMTQHIHNLQMATAEIENNFEKLPMEMLKDAKDTLERNEKLLLRNPVFSSPRWTKYPIPGRTDMLLTFFRDITIDPETVNPQLILSDDFKRVELVSVPQDVPENHEILNYPLHILGTQSFTSGKHYWEVEVDNITEWQVGICQISTSKENKDDGLKDFCTGLIFASGKDFSLEGSHADDSVSQSIHKVGIFLDYERGHLAFYNAADETLIFSPIGDFFQGPVRPCFSPCFRNVKCTPASICFCPRKTSFKDVKENN